MFDRLTRRVAFVGAILILPLMVAACDSFGDPPAWSAQEMRVDVQYDTVLPVGNLPITVRFDTVTTNRLLRMYVQVTATNLSDRPFVGYTGFPECHWVFAVYDNPDRTGEPLWHQEEERTCRQGGLPISIAPGESMVFPASFLPFWDIVETRGPGTYYFTTQLWGKTDGQGDGPSVWLTEAMPAGEVVLVQ